MVLPGISGSLVLILAGEYYTVVKAFSGLKDLQTEHMAYLFFLGIGIIVGLLLFARLVEYIFRRFHDQTIAFLCGLIAGSLYALWPFKEAVVFDKYVRTDGAITVVNDAVVYTNNNILPKDPSEFLFSMVFCVLGIAAMWCMSLLDKRQE